MGAPLFPGLLGTLSAIDIRWDLKKYPPNDPKNLALVSRVTH
jgi:hypothetical protein